MDAELIAGGGGIFDVTVDGKRIYCKHEAGKFPDKGEIVGLLSP
ncbi:MAG: putative Rdx family selenoprotein [Verrucomicrobiales bacterium]